MECVNFDLPEVVATAAPLEGVEHVGGDMFKPETFPSGADCIFMKHILHDWSDEDSVKVLKSLHQVSLNSLSHMMCMFIPPSRMFMIVLMSPF